MSTESRPGVTLVLASIDAMATIEISVRAFLEQLGEADRLIVVDASRDGSGRRAGEISPRVDVLSREPGTLAPQLWREGLLAAGSEFIAFSTAQMTPRPGWLAAMLGAIGAEGVAGVGGPIAAAPSLGPTDRAMYLLRYANYLPPVPDSRRFEPPGDNAIYRRADLLAFEDAWRDGLWEVEVHARMRREGRSLAMCPGAIVDFRGGNTLGAALSHRLAHARRFGAGRCRGRGWATKAARTATAPAVPALLLARIVRNLRDRGEPLGPWLPALPRLGVLLSTWSLGEAAGALLGPGRMRAA